MAKSDFNSRARLLLEQSLKPERMSDGDIGPDADRIVSVTADLLQQAHHPLMQWFGADGTSILLDRVLDRTQDKHPVLSGASMGVVDSTVQICLKQDGVGVEHCQKAAVKEAMVALIEALLSLLSRLIGTDLVNRLTHEAWPHETSYDDS